MEGQMGNPREGPRDEILVVAAIMGDLDAFNLLASRYRAAVVRAAESIVGRQHAEDVAQEALLLAFKALPSIECPAKFATWLNAITRNRALRFLKREQAASSLRVELDEVLLERLGALAHMPERETDQQLDMALEKVPHDYALVLRLRFFDQMPLKRIAAFLGVPLSTVKWRLHRGKKLLREQIEDLRGVAHEATIVGACPQQRSWSWKEKKK
jgi:RNA polymerase sigma-70 factor (ECF subfamily)